MAAETLNSLIDLALGNVPNITDDMDPQEVYEAMLKVHHAIEILVDFYDTAGGLYVTLASAQTISGNKTFNADLIIAAAKNIVLNNITGTKIGTSTTQKLGFWNKTPVIQPAAANQAALVNSTGGTRDGTLQNVNGAGSLGSAASGAATNNNFTDIYALLTEMRTALVNSGIMKGSA